MPVALLRDRAILVGALATGSLVAWIVTVQRMRGMDAGPGTDLGGLGWFVGIWVTMMAAMMLPSAAPMVLLFARVSRERARKGLAELVPSWLFVSGYLLVWTAVGLAAYGLYRAIVSAGTEWLSWDRGGPYVAGAALAAAGVYQLTPLKDVCLRHCRSPLHFLLHDWREGRAGAVWMGIEHGAFCLGCCAGLMVALFALGVMSLFWMAVVAAVILVEKVAPRRPAAQPRVRDRPRRARHLGLLRTGQRPGPRAAELARSRHGPDAHDGHEVVPWSVRGSYLESCNCDAICPCRRIDGAGGGRSTHGVCLGTLSWLVEEGHADGVALDGLGVVLAIRYDDDEPGSPWTVWLYLDDRGTDEQRAALEEIFLGARGGDIVEHAPWIWKDSRVLGVSAATVQIDHTPRRQWFRVRDRIEVRVAAPVDDQPAVTCVIPGHDRQGEELTVEVLRVDEEPPLAFEYRGVCAYASTFDYSG